MSTISDFQEFADSLRERYREMRRDSTGLLRAAAGGRPPAAADPLYRVAAMFESTLDELDAAADVLQEQNEALFAARVEMEAEGRLYRELFDLAPAACLVTTGDAQITHANQAATSLFGRPSNALVGRLMVSFVDAGERGAFRSALTRARTAPSVETVPIRIVGHGAWTTDCRVRVSARREGDRVRALQWVIAEDGSSDGDLL